VQTPVDVVGVFVAQAIAAGAEIARIDAATTESVSEPVVSSAAPMSAATTEPATKEASLDSSASGSSDVTITPAHAEDVRGILELERVCFSSDEETFNKRQVRYLLNCPRATVAVARDAQGQVIGWSVGLVRQHRRGKSGRLYTVAVRPDAQGRRIGEQLVRQTLDSLAGMGIEKVYLEVRVDNQAAIGLYRKMGFFDETLLPNYYAQSRHAYRMMIRQTAKAMTPSVAPVAVMVGMAQQ
jgi:ribosomal protein S18 acetylase RimI-like enzyme